MILDQLYPRKINESLADEFMAMAKAKGMNPRLRGTPDEERARTDAMLAQRAADRANAPKPQPIDAETRAHLQDQLKSLEATFDPNYEYSDDHSFWKEQSSIAQQINRIKAELSRGISESRQRKLNEAQLMEDPVYRKFKTVGRYIAERKMSEKEILQVFADAEAGMTDKGTGANRTFLGRGKDTAADFAGGVADALKGVWSGIQSSVPVAAVDVAYDQATDALGKLAGGQKGAVMQAIKKYRMLAKQYPKTAGLAKGALVAIAGLATGGAGAPAIAAFVYGLDSAIKGEKFSDIALKAGGAAATAWAASKVASAVGGDQAASGAEGSGIGDPSQLPPFDDAGNLSPGFHINPEDGIPYYNGELAPTPADVAAGLAPDSTAGLTTGADAGAAASGAEGFGGGTYTTMPGDQGGYIAQANGVPFKDLEALNPQITNWNKLPPGTELQLPPSGPNTGSVWGSGAPSTPAPQGPELLGGPAAGSTPQISPADVKPFGSGAPDTSLLSNPYGAVRSPLAQPGSYSGTLSGVTADQIYNSPVYKQVYADQVAKFGSTAAGQLRASQVATMAAKAAMVRESTEFLQSVKMRKLPFDKLVDQKSTVMSWALSESIGVKRKSVHLSAVGTYTVFENVDRCRKAVMELAGVPGSTRPAYYRPDMPDAPAPTKAPKNQSWFGKGLDYLDKGVKKVGGALSNFGHQFTTNVTKEKLKMNWHQAGKPSDSDQLAAWLVKQGVPQEVVTSVYGKMGIPYTAPAATEPAATEPQAKTGGAQRQMAFYGTNPATQKPWTYDELQAKSQTTPAATPADTPADTSATTTPTTNPVGFNAGNIFKQPGMEKYAKPAPAKTPNFAQQGGGYGKTTTTVKPMTGIPGMKPAAAPAPTATAPAPVSGPMKIGGQTLNPKNPADKKIIDKVQAQTAKVAEALKRPVAEMLSMVETKEDVAKIKQFIDQTFVKYGAVSESAFVVRNSLIEHVTQVGAQRRREFARKS